jgi:hypothetical protein
MPGKGRPFSKGVSGNPGGRPKVLGDVQDLAPQESPEAINTLSNIMHDEKAPPAAGWRPCAERTARGPFEAQLRHSIRATDRPSEILPVIRPDETQPRDQPVDVKEGTDRSTGCLAARLGFTLFP